MHRPHTAAVATLGRELASFVLERHPFAAAAASVAFDACGGHGARDAAAIDALRAPFARELRARLQPMFPDHAGETTPRVTAKDRFTAAIAEVVEQCDGFLHRAAIRA